MLTCLLGCLTSTTGALNEVKQLESSQYDAHVASSRLNKARKMGRERLTTLRFHHGHGFMGLLRNHGMKCGDDNSRQLIFHQLSNMAGKSWWPMELASWRIFQRSIFFWLLPEASYEYHIFQFYGVLSTLGTQWLGCIACFHLSIWSSIYFFS